MEEWVRLMIGPIVTLALAAGVFYAAFAKLSGEVKVQLNDMKETMNEVKRDVSELKNDTIRQGQTIVRLDEKFNALADKVERNNHVVERTAKLESDQATYWTRYDDMAARVSRLEER